MAEHQCPGCGQRFERIAQHWAMGSCAYPMLSPQQRSVLQGMVISGATLAGSGANHHVSIGTAAESLAQWTADRLDWLCQSMRTVDSSDDHDPTYRVRTTAHPQINRFQRWRKLPSTCGRRPPADITIPRTAARVWWAYSGGLQWQGEWDSQRVATFSALYDERAGGILNVLENAGYSPVRAGKRVQLAPVETTRWLQWVGDPVPGVAHKWAESLVEYRTRRKSPETDVQSRVERARTAVEIAAARTDQRPITPSLFDRRVEAVDADTVADVLGGGSFEAALRVVGVRHSYEAPRKDPGLDE